MSFIYRESENERKTRLKLDLYRKQMAEEVGVFEKLERFHTSHVLSLIDEFEGQEIQLQKWGLLDILPAFRMQAWSRVSRALLLENMAKTSLEYLINQAAKAAIALLCLLMVQLQSPSYHSMSDMTSITRFCGLKLIRVLHPGVVSQEPS